MQRIACWRFWRYGQALVREVAQLEYLWPYGPQREKPCLLVEHSEQHVIYRLVEGAGQGSPRWCRRKGFFDQVRRKTSILSYRDMIKYWMMHEASRGVPEGKIKVRRGWVLEGVSPSHTLGKKIKIWTKWWLLLHFLNLNTDLIVSKTKVKTVKILLLWLRIITKSVYL